MTSEAMANDETFASSLAELDLPQSTTPRISEWNGIRDDLAALNDRVGVLIQVTTAAAGGKPQKAKPHPRPITAGERIKQRQRQDRHHALVARMKRQEGGDG